MSAWVWVAYATPQQQWYITLPFEAGMTVAQALQACQQQGLTELPQPLQLGIFAQRVQLDHVLKAGDRVEVYRALTINPKDIRRLRAERHPVGRYVRRLRTARTKAQ